MSQNNRNSNPIYLLGAIAGIISATVTVLTYLEIKPSSLIPSFDNLWPENQPSETQLPDNLPSEDIPPPENQPPENLPPSIPN